MRCPSDVPPANIIDMKRLRSNTLELSPPAGTSRSGGSVAASRPRYPLAIKSEGDSPVSNDEFSMPSGSRTDCLMHCAKEAPHRFWIALPSTVMPRLEYEKTAPGG